jgi:hypothetical protein
MNMIIDIAVVILLSVSILYIHMLKKRIADIRSAQDDLVVIVHQFDDAIIRAHNTIELLKKESSKAISDMRFSAAEAERLSDDLMFLLRKSDESAERLSRTISQSKSVDNTGFTAHSATNTTTAIRPSTTSSPKMEQPTVTGKKEALSAAIHAVLKRNSATPTASTSNNRNAPPTTNKEAAIELLLQQISAQRGPLVEDASATQARPKQWNGQKTRPDTTMQTSSS